MPIKAGFPVKKCARLYKSEALIGEVWHGLEAANYLANNGSLVSTWFFAMEALAENEGFPQADTYEEIDEMIFWRALNHLVIYERKEHDKVVQIDVIKPHQ